MFDKFHVLWLLYKTYGFSEASLSWFSRRQVIFNFEFVAAYIQAGIAILQNYTKTKHTFKKLVVHIKQVFFSKFS